MHLTFFTP